MISKIEVFIKVNIKNISRTCFNAIFSLFLCPFFQYLIVKDPNKPVLRLYDIPDSTFESDEDSDEDDDVEGKFKT